MVRVTVWESVRDATGGAAEVEVEAGSIRELLERLGETYPALAPRLARGVSVSVDGILYARATLVKLAPDSEVVLLPRIEGG